ncbi:LIM domain-containing protein HDR3 isoform X2 [Cucumis melo]|uniref:LIM domain-containing protein HDR3 isoform X2 n=1 Tax=Cucumis melo TaxID=3656 RepID=A0A1S3BAU7_CUCME|nr:LIM domain-containing protein HDR3 isoform X2 [Cucumis melo]
MGWLSKILKVGSGHRIAEKNYQANYEEDPNSHLPSTSEGLWSENENEDIDRAIAISLVEESQKANNVIDRDYQLEEDELLAKAVQESLNLESPPQYTSGNMYQPYLPQYQFGSRICAGCYNEIGYGRYLNCLNAFWHPECFRCRACNLPISDYEFSTSGNFPYHKSCYKENYHPKCDVCKHFIPTNPAGLIEYRAHPFWIQKYCPSHEYDGTPRCCSCERMEGHYHIPETRGLCLSEEQTISTVLRRPRYERGNRVSSTMSEPYKLTRHCEVTAILILFGLPRLLTGSILAHEMMHAWLRLKGFRTLSQDVEEGICQVLAHMWLSTELMSSQDYNDVASTSYSAAPTTSSRRKTMSKFERKLGEFFKHQIESDMSPVYGDGFRAGQMAVHKYGLRTTLDHIQMTGTFPY